MSNLFVKFVRWNANSITSLINDTIKFSTVYEFNDFNELRYIGIGKDFDTKCNEQNYDILKREILSINFLNNLILLAKERCNQEYFDKINMLIQKGNPNELLDCEKYQRLLQENLAYSNVGIFCASDIKVFASDSAQLMYAHYADNLKGIALIYAVEELGQLHKIDYGSKNKVSSGEPARYLRWYKSDFRDISDFLKKSNKWAYENEIRMFNKPGIISAKEKNIVLKGILYTSRFTGEIKTLIAINKGFYNGNLIIEGLDPSRSRHEFTMRNGDNVIDFLKGIF